MTWVETLSIQCIETLSIQCPQRCIVRIWTRYYECREELLRNLENGVSLIVDRYAFSGAVFTAAKRVPGLTLKWCQVSFLHANKYRRSLLPGQSWSLLFKEKTLSLTQMKNMSLHATNTAKSFNWVLCVGLEFKRYICFSEILCSRIVISHLIEAC